MARPSKLTDEVQEATARLIKVGVTVEVAAETVGISPETFYDWMRRGELKGSREAKYRKFRAAVEQARAEAEATLVTRVAKAASNGSWQAAAWLLERRSPERWAKIKERPNGLDDDEAAEAKSPAEAIRDELAEKRAARA